MKTINLIEKNITVDASGNIEVAFDKEGLRQKIETRLSLYRGEWFLDISVGVPYFQSLLGRAGGPVVDILNNEVLKETEVVKIVESGLSDGDKQRSIVYTATIQTIYGDTIEVSTEVQ